ncbi:hypothetical protein LABALGNA3A7_04400 [Dellaglioa algida]|nr:hypothetical protein LABALGNA3A7_04400 [Dellaglioa algida]
MMKGNDSSKKRWVSTVLMTGIILAGMVPAGAVVSAVSRNDSTILKQEMSQLTNDPKSGFEKITADADVQKAKEEASDVTDKETVATEDKDVPVIKDEGTTEVKDEVKAKEESTKNDEKTATDKKEAVVPTAGYDGPKTDPTGTTWIETDISASSATAYVSPSGAQNRPDEPVLYFGNKTLKFQPSSLTNNNNYVTGKNMSSWTYVGRSVNEMNPNPSKAYGIIINNAIPADRGYHWFEKGVTNSIETAVQSGKVTDYKLYKNTAGTGFKATMYDTAYNLSYTFIEMYDGAGGLYSYFSITNNDTKSRAIGAVQAADTFVDDDKVPIRSLGPDAGFKMKGDNHTLNYMLNNPLDGTKLGGWKNYTAGGYTDIMDPAYVGNYFIGGVLGEGMEKSAAEKNITVSNVNTPTPPITTDSGFVIKTNPESLKPGESLTNGSYLTYKEIATTKPPVATVTAPIINAYEDQADALEIKGTVSDPDGTKGRIRITYPDKTTSAASENMYDTGTVGKSKDYTAKIKRSKLKLGVNKLTVIAIDDKENEQTKVVPVTVTLFNLGATPIPQKIDVGGKVSTVETELIKDMTIMGTPTPNAHTLEIDGSNPSGKPLDNSVVGFYIQDMLLTDTVVSPNKVAKIPVPVNVTDSDTITDNTSAVYAKSFTTKSDALSGLTSKDKLDTFILTESKAKGWILATGANSAVSVTSTTLTDTSVSGVYEAVIQNSNGKEITIKITVSGDDLKITAAPDTMSYGASTGVMLPYSSEDFNLQRKDVAKVSISNLGKQRWNLSAKVSEPLRDGANTLTGVLKYVDTNNVVTDLDNGSVIVGSGETDTTQDVTWDDPKQGIIANINGSNTSLKVGTYTGEIEWTLTSAP